MMCLLFKGCQEPDNMYTVGSCATLNIFSPGLGRLLPLAVHPVTARRHTLKAKQGEETAKRRSRYRNKHLPVTGFLLSVFVLGFFCCFFCNLYIYKMAKTSHQVSQQKNRGSTAHLECVNVRVVCLSVCVCVVCELFGWRVPRTRLGVLRYLGRWLASRKSLSLQVMQSLRFLREPPAV